ncbi:MAG: stage IV sporulation protein FB [Paracoccaceae bacterium]
MFEFKLFNIPVRVEPWFWLTGFLLGRGFNIDNRQDFIGVILWMLIVFVSIIVHEFGHALTSRKFTGVNPNVRLWAMGGLAYPNTHLTRKQSFWVTWAGPLAGLGLFVLTALLACLALGFSTGLNLIGILIYPKIGITPDTLLALSQMHWVTIEILYGMVFVNFWWSIINLLPVFPLDGGQIYAAVETSQKKVFQVGMIVGIVVAVIALVQFKMLFAAALFGYLAYQNYQRLQQITGGGR